MVDERVPQYVMGPQYWLKSPCEMDEMSARDHRGERPLVDVT